MVTVMERRETTFEREWPRTLSAKSFWRVSRDCAKKLRGRKQEAGGKVVGDRRRRRETGDERGSFK
jgi:hypothetical protein